jgi:hypothetical protein
MTNAAASSGHAAPLKKSDGCARDAKTLTAAANTRNGWSMANLVLQLHQFETEHHHGTIGDPGQPLGNGVAVWFEVDDFDVAVTRIRELDAELVEDVHVNPNAGHREIWIRDPMATSSCSPSHLSHRARPGKDQFILGRKKGEREHVAVPCAGFGGGAGVGWPRRCNGSGLAGQSLMGV